MTVQIKTIDLEPKRQTFGHVARRLGGDKPASRYQEATLDVQATANFHYKPLWEPEYWQYDTRKTAVVMEDWYKPLDPRQFYYATYNIARANMNQAVERNFAFIEERGLIEKLSAETKAADRARPPAAAPSALGLEHEHDRDHPARLRHGGHRALHLLGRRSSRHGADHLAHRPRARRPDRREPRQGQGDLARRRRLAGRAQADRGHASSSATSSSSMSPRRSRVNGVLFDMFYKHADAAWREGALPVAMLTEFMSDWRAEEGRWSDHVVKTVAAESDANKTLVSDWASHWIDRAIEAAKPLSDALLKDDGKAAHTARRGGHSPRAFARSVDLTEGTNIMMQVASLTLLHNDDARPIIEAIMADNPGVRVLDMPGCVKLDRDMELVVNRASVEERIGRAWDPQEIHLVLVSMAGNLDEDDDRFLVGWKH